MGVHAKITQVAIALAALLAGVFIYLAERSGLDVYFLPDGWQAVWPMSWLGQHLPSFLHTFAFAMLTAAVLAPARYAAIISCAFWVLVNSLLEVGQRESIATEISGHTPAWFLDWPVLENVNSYFLFGTFDSIDIAFVVIGGATALLTLGILQQVGDAS
jgi:hypothetical protein